MEQTCYRRLLWRRTNRQIHSAWTSVESIHRHPAGFPDGNPGVNRIHLWLCWRFNAICVRLYTIYWCPLFIVIPPRISHLLCSSPLSIAKRRYFFDLSRSLHNEEYSTAFMSVWISVNLLHLKYCKGKRFIVFILYRTRESGWNLEKTVLSLYFMSGTSNTK